MLCVDEKVFRITGDEECTLHWSEYGLQIDIPANSLSAGETTNLEVKAIIGGDFTVPCDCHMISGIYWIYCPMEFNNRVKLHLSHAAIIQSEEEVSHFKFHAAKCSSGPPYLFKELEGGSFVPSSRSANIQLKQFSFFGLGGRKPRIKCCYNVFYKLKQPDIEWHTIFVITKDDSTFKKVSSLIISCVMVYKLSEYNIALYVGTVGFSG